MEKSKLKGMVFAALFAALTGAVAWFKIPLPFTPVPITLQTLMVLLSGTMLGPYYGALAMLLYLTVGAIGLPVFAGGSSGVGALLGPTGGYLFSYPVAAYLIGVITQKKITKLLSKNLTFIIGIIAIIAFIVGYVTSFSNFFISFKSGDKPISSIFYLFGIYLLIYSFATLLFGKIANSFIKYFAFTIILILVFVVSFDFAFKRGILQGFDDVTKSNFPIVSKMTESQRMIILILSIVIIIGLLFLIVYLKKSKSFSIDTILAMFAGTLIIYILGSIQGKIVTGLQWSAIFVGWVLPFIVGDTIKLLLAAWIAKNIDINKYMK